MSQTLELLVLLTALGLLVGVSALAGAIWGQVHGWPRARALRLAEELADRLNALEARPQAPADPVPAATARHRADPPAPSAVAGPMLIEVPELPRASGTGAAAAAELAARFGTIWALADDGAPPESIARQTGQPIGQVELVLGLRRQLAAGPRERP
jgi:hypothetical protein